MQLLSMEEVVSIGVEFKDDVCFSGEYGQQVYTKEIDKGGIPVEGILYEKYSNGRLAYYAYYEDGIPNGISVSYYPSGSIESYCVMDAGTIDGEYTGWYEDGTLKVKKICKYGFVLSMKEFDEKGNMVKEKKGLDESEKKRYEKLANYYEKR